MKTVIHIFLLGLISQFSLAQNASFSTSTELGINVNILLDKFIFDDAPIAGQPLNLPDRLDPILTFKYNYAKNYTLRFGGGFQNEEVRDTFVSPGFAEFYSSQEVRSIYMNFGFQKQFDLQKKLKAYWGFDFIYRNGQLKNTNEQKIIDGNVFAEDFWAKDTLTKNDFGIGIPMGIQYYFSKNISISTEMYGEFLAVFQKTKSDNSQTSPQEEELGDKYQAKFRAPLILYLNFQF